MTTTQALARYAVRLAALCGLAIVFVVFAADPRALAAFVVFLAPVFVPALLGVLVALHATWSHRRWSPAALVTAAVLMTPGFALAMFLATHDHPASYPHSVTAEESAAHLVRTLAPLGALAALVSIPFALLPLRRERVRIPWPLVIGVADLIVLLADLTVATPG